MKKEYVLGFFFGCSLGSVALIRKTKPEFQRGKLNGIGGKIEPDDLSPYTAMVREFEEETGLNTSIVFWQKFAIMEFPQARVFCFAYAGGASILELRTTTDEKVERHSSTEDFTHPKFLPNLRWLIPLAKASLLGIFPTLTISEGAGDYASLQHDAGYALQQDALVARFYTP